MHTKCCICGCNDGYFKYPNSRNWDGRSLSCNICYLRRYRKDNPHITKKNNEILSRISNWKNGELDPYTSAGKGYIVEQFTCKTLGIKNLNIVNNSFRYKFDGEKNVQIKGVSLNKQYGKWLRHIRDTEEFDNLIFVCMDDKLPWKNVMRVYNIPEMALYGKRTISISENPCRGGGMWREFRIDERQFNDIYRNMTIDDCPALRKDKWEEWLTIIKK